MIIEEEKTGKGRAVSVWMGERLLYRLQRSVIENHQPSRSWVISEAVRKYLDDLESFEELIRRDRKELSEVPK